MSLAINAREDILSNLDYLGRTVGDHRDAEAARHAALVINAMTREEWIAIAGRAGGVWRLPSIGEPFPDGLPGFSRR